MAEIHEIDEMAWNKWVCSRPKSVQELCRKFPPNRLYKLRSTGHRCMVYSYSEDGTMTVNVTGEHNVVLFSRAVFGIKPEDLTECEPPAKGEMLGEAMTQDEAREFIRKAYRNSKP